MSTLYPQFCLALGDDYEGVRSIALSLIHVLATANPEEAVKIKEDWLLQGTCKPEPDAYCFEMLSLVLALSGSSVGRTHLATQHGLIQDLIQVHFISEQ